MELIRKKIIADFVTPVGAFSIFKKNKYCFLLESVEKGKAARYSFLGFGPRQVYKLYSDRVEVFKRKNKEYKIKQTVVTKNPLEYIQNIQDKYKINTDNNLPPFCGGLVGFAGYEIIKTWEKINFKHDFSSDFPLGVFMFADEFVVFDHLHRSAEVIKLIVNGRKKEKKNAEKRVSEIAEKLTSAKIYSKFLNLEEKKDVGFESNFTKQEFEKKVQEIKENIFSGQIIQGVFSQRISVDCNEDPFDYYRALRVINPSPYMFYLRLDDIFLCGSSPEILVKVEGCQAVVRPIAGTRPRGVDESEEKEMMEELKSDPKERAEHIMLVDLGRNDLGRVCKYGTVNTSNLMTVEKYSHVMHLVTDVKGELKKGVKSTQVFKSCFPAGTVSGAPKLKAIEIISDKENCARGPYAGSVGYFSFTGDMDMCITIRTITVYKGKAFIQAGAGIVADSVPENEYQETLNKAKALLNAVKIAGNNTRRK